MTIEEKKFDAEVGKVLHLMIHSLYTNKEIFLRELVSNASDACDKLKFLALTDENLTDGDNNFKITIKIDKENKKIIVRDNGIGMDKQDLIDNLGTIARSGTQRFAQSLANDKNQSKVEDNLIGQFGVGFYSSFMVADEVSVISKKAGESSAYQWLSDGISGYTVSEYNQDFSRGTEVNIKIKDSEEGYLDHFRLKHIIKNYSDHISVPISYIDETGNEAQVNSASALWRRTKSEISGEQYKEFYQHISHASDEPWLTMHNKNEGLIEYNNLLFIPSTKTFDLFHPDRKRRVKLYIKKVFVSDENVDLIPSFLRFLRGVVDTESLPLNISRETLQHNSVLKKIEKSITDRVINELKKKKENDAEGYDNFWNNFGGVLKEGLCEASTDHEKLLEICIFKSALTDKMISLDEYIANVKDDQKTIYYLSGDDYNKLKMSPQIEGFLNKNIDVLLLTDAVDDFWVNVNSKYKDFDLKSATRSDIDLSNDNAQNDSKKTSEDSQKLEIVLKYFKDVLGDLVKDIKLSKRLTSTVACLAVNEGVMDIRLERFLREQKQLSSATAKNLELNPKHKIIEKINEDLQSSPNSRQNDDLVRLIFDSACILENEPVVDANDFSKRLDQILQRAILNS